MKRLHSLVFAGAVTAVFLLTTAAVPELLLPAFIGYVCITVLSTAVYDYTRRPAMGT
ncbi:MAG: hypothetical protein U1F61_26540 [Opitutaceae bacterium]